MAAGLDMWADDSRHVCLVSYDPAGGSNLVTKMGIDATRKSNYPDEIAVPGFEAIDMAAFIPGYRP